MRAGRQDALLFPLIQGLLHPRSVCVAAAMLAFVLQGHPAERRARVDVALPGVEIDQCAGERNVDGDAFEFV